jgi:2-polyprenyl-3-methyl-5-hydroxy-6-metoxy-1,4-benzoquinol methylase
MLVEWAQNRGVDGRGRRALVVGCGLGQDAEYVAGHGFDAVAFDIAPTAVP